MKPKRKLCEPKPNEKCLCGSNLKYKRCCARRLPGAQRIGKDYPRRVGEGEFEGAIEAARADVTQYTIWHQSHTARGLFEGTSISAERIWHVDIEALSEYAERLLFAYRYAGLLEEMPAVLERLRRNIDSEAWRNKIIYLQSLCALGEDWNVELGFREISKLGPIDEVTDPILLAMYLNLAGPRISLASRLRLIDRVVDETEDDSTRIHQSLVKAALLYGHNDLRGAEEAVRKVIQYSEELDDLDPYQTLKLGQACYLLGGIELDKREEGTEHRKHLDRAIECFKKLLTQDGLSTSGLAGVHRDLADAFRLLGEWHTAFDHYVKASNVQESPILQVFRAECLNRLNRRAEALEVLDALTIEGFQDDAERADFVLKFAAIAVDTGDRERLGKARSLLGLDLEREPIHLQQALRMRSVVLDTIQHGKSASLQARAWAVLSEIGSAIMLQPNFMGVGFDFNKLIERSRRASSGTRAHLDCDDEHD